MEKFRNAITGIMSLRVNLPDNMVTRVEGSTQIVLEPTATMGEYSKVAGVRVCHGNPEYALRITGLHVNTDFEVDVHSILGQLGGDNCITFGDRFDDNEYYFDVKLSHGPENMTWDEKEEIGHVIKSMVAAFVA